MFYAIFLRITKKIYFRPDPGAGADAEEKQTFDCPKCNREFRNTTLLTRHVNDCLDRDFWVTFNAKISKKIYKESWTIEQILIV